MSLNQRQFDVACHWVGAIVVTLIVVAFIVILGLPAIQNGHDENMARIHECRYAKNVDLCLDRER